jgi:hypothetical protein
MLSVLFMLLKKQSWPDFVRTEVQAVSKPGIIAWFPTKSNENPRGDRPVRLETNPTIIYNIIYNLPNQ